MVHSTIWWVSAFCSSRIVTSSATSRCSAETSFSSSLRVAACTATGSRAPAAATARPAPDGSAGQRVGRLGGRELGDQHQVTGDGPGLRPGLLAERCGQRSGALVVAVVVGVAGVQVGGETGQVAGHVQWGVGTQGAGEHPDQRLPADERVAGRAHHLGD
jgi:hypothetical protein